MRHVVFFMCMLLSVFSLVVENPAVAAVTGTVRLTDSSWSDILYQRTDRVYIEVKDQDVDTTSDLAESITVNLSSDTEGDFEAVTLTESGANTGIFRGSIPVDGSGTPVSDGDLDAKPGDTIIVTYSDAVDGSGNPGALQDSAFYPTVMPGGAMSADTVWPSANSPYLVTGDITVDAGVTLTIEPGTKVVFSKNSDDRQGGWDSYKSELTVYGTLIAQGTSSERIVFTSDAVTPQAGDWCGIFFFGGQGTLDYCDIQYASYYAVYLDNASPVISHSLISTNAGYGLYCSNSSNPLIDGNTISNNAGSGIYVDDSSPAITNNTIQNNGEEWGAGVYCYSLSPEDGFVVVIDNNTISGSYYGVYCAGFSKADITGNTINMTKYGIETYSPAIISHNRITGNDYAGITIYTSYGSSGSGPPIINWNSLHGNGSLAPSGLDAGDIVNSSAFNINARYNWWGDKATAEMNSGPNPKNISTIYDYYDEYSYGIVNYSRWLGSEDGNPVTTASTGVIQLTDAGWKDVDCYRSGEAVYIQLTDPDLNADPDTPETIIVHITSDVEDTGTPSSATTPVPGPSNTGDGEMSEIITGLAALTEDWTLSYNWDYCVFSVTGSASGRHADAIPDAAYTSTNGEVAFTICWGMQNWAPSDTFTFSTVAGSPVAEPVTLTESDPDSGIFRGSIVCDNSGAGVVDGDLDLWPGNRITVLYNESADEWDVERTHADTALYTVTTASGEISDDTTWISANSPYLVTGDVTVKPGATLTIEPGTTVVFLAGKDDQQGGRDTSHSEIIVEGRLMAQGTASQEILFTSSSKYPGSGDWHGLFFSGGEGVIDHAAIQYAHDGIYLQAASPAITNSTISLNQNYGVYSSGLSSARIEGNVISNNYSGGIYCGSASDLRIERNTISANNSDGICCSQSSPVITGNKILYNRGSGIRCYSPDAAEYSSPVITNNTLIGNADGITGNRAHFTIRNNVLRNQSNAISLYDAGNVIIELNTITNNNRGVYCDLGSGAADPCTVKGNIITYNLWGIDRFDASDSFVLTGNDVWRNRTDYSNVTPGETDLSLDPLYNDILSGDVTLRIGSPLLTAGEGGTQIGAYGGGGEPPAVITPPSTTPTTSGTLDQNEIWSGEVHVIADVTVPENLILKIEPGTTVKFNDGAGLYVDGMLAASGTPDAGITFTSSSLSPAAGSWDGIRFNESSCDTGLIENALIEYAENGIYCYSAAPGLNDILIQQNNTGVHIRAANPVIERCVISGNTDGLYLDGCAPTVSDNYLVRNSTGIRGYYSDPLIKNNIITENTQYGISLCWNDEAAVVQFNIIAENSYGIYLDRSSSVVDSNIISGNTYGVYSTGTDGFLCYNDVWENHTNYRGVAPGGGDISADPLFVSEEDLHLQPGSVCVDRGDPYYLDEDGSRADIGAYGGRGGFNGSPDNSLPDQPVNSSPTSGATGLPLSVVLSAGPFLDPDETDFQTAAQWQIRADGGDYSSPIFDSGENKTDLNSATVPCGQIQAGAAYFWRVRYKDNKNAWSDYSEETSFSTAPDLIPPETAITYGPTEGSATGPSVVFKWSRTDNSGCPPVYSYRLDENEWSAFTSTSIEDFTGLGHGSHVFSVKAMDGSNNIDGTPAVCSFGVDVIPPVISNVRIPPEQVMSTSARVLWETDEPARSKIEYWIDGKSHKWAEDRTLETDHDVPVTGLIPDETYHVIVHSRDACGNESSTAGQPVTFTTFDNVPPEDVTNLRVQSFDTKLVFTWNHSADTYGDLSGYRVYFNGAAEPVSLDKAINTYECPGLSPATAYEFKITACDATGHESSGVLMSGITLLDNPGGLQATPYSGCVNLSWSGTSASQYLKHYAVYVSDHDFSTVEGMMPRATTTRSSTRITGLSNNATYYFAVTSVSASGGEEKEVTALPAMPVIDAQGPSILDFKLNGAPFVEGAVLHYSGVFTVSAIDSAGLSRMEFYLDGVFYHSCTGTQGLFSCSLEPTSFADGNHNLTIRAYDTFGNAGTADYVFTVALEPPPAPVISEPANGTLTNTRTIKIRGLSGRQTEILFFNNGIPAGNPVSVDGHGDFMADVTLHEGENRIHAAARNRAGTGPLSAETVITVDTSIPKPPSGFSAQAVPGGVVKLSWTNSQGTVKGHNLYRAKSLFNTVQEAVKINSCLIAGTVFQDIPPDDAKYYYRVTAVNSAGAESGLSAEAVVQPDRAAPRAVSIAWTPKGNHDPETARMAQGMVGVLLTASEPLKSVPFLSITPRGGVPIPVALTRLSAAEFSGLFAVSNSMPSGTAYAVFSGHDLVGNRGTEIDSGGTIEIDTQGPAVNRITIQPADPIENDPDTPAAITVMIGLNDAMKPGRVPELSYLLSGAGRDQVAVAVQETTPESGQVQAWQGTFILPADAGVPAAETLQFMYSGMDDLGNVSTGVLCKNSFQVYQGDLPPLSSPQDIQGKSLPAGRIGLSWNAVEEAAGYLLYRQAPDETELTEHRRLDPVLAFIDEPLFDGIYTYAIASIRLQNGREAVSGRSNPVQVVSDHVPPEPPLNLTLSLSSKGIAAQWEAPLYTERVSYSLYRSSLLEITSLSGMTPVIAGIEDTAALDAYPSHTDHSYVVTAVDDAGNESPPSNSFYLNFELLPVSTLQVVREENNPPVISWTHPGSTGVIAYDLYIGPESDLRRVNQAPTARMSHTDTTYVEGDRRYTVVAVDANSKESPARSITLPSIQASLSGDRRIVRGTMNRVEYLVENRSCLSADHVRLNVRIADKRHVSAESDIRAGRSRRIPVVVGGYSGLSSPAAVTTIIEITPHEGEKVEVVRTEPIETVPGALVAGIIHEDFVRGGMGRVRFTLENTGGANVEIVTAQEAASKEINLSLLDQDGNILSHVPYDEGTYSVTTGLSVKTILPGAVYTSEPVDISVPVSSPDEVVVQLEIARLHYHAGEPDAISIDGISTRRQITLTETPYFGEVDSVTPETSIGDRNIVITGRAVDRITGLPSAKIPLNVVVSLRGSEQSHLLYTDESGCFSYEFTPLPGECGLYRVCAVHPDITYRPVMSTFTITRVTVYPEIVRLSIPRNYEKTLTLKAVVSEGSAVRNLRLSYEKSDQLYGALPQGIHVSLGEPLQTLDSTGPGDLSFSVWGDNNAPDTETIALNVKSDEKENGSWDRVLVCIHLSKAEPVLGFSPNHVETGLAFGETGSERITLENKGLADLRDIRLSLSYQDGRPAPGWVHLNSDPDQGDMAVGGKRQIELAFNPALTTAQEGMHAFVLRVMSSNYPATDIYIYVSVTQSGIGGALFKITDIYTGTFGPDGKLIQGLAGARITLQNEAALNIQQTMTADAAGEALFTGLPAGKYKFKVNADSHHQYIGRIWIRPDITVSQPVFLEYTAVTVFWEVKEITVEDRYEIVLSITYETEIPVPVLITEPVSARLPSMVPGDVYEGSFSLTNMGLIRADDIRFILPVVPNCRYEILKDLPDSLGPKERMLVPYRVVCTGLEGGSETEGSWPGVCQSRIDVPFNYLGFDGKMHKGFPAFHFNFYPCPKDDPEEFDMSGDGGEEEYQPLEWLEKEIICRPPLRSVPVNDEENIKAFAERIGGADRTGAVDLSRGEYVDRAVDISVKCQGYPATGARRYYDGRWRFDYADDRLESAYRSDETIDFIYKDGIRYTKSDTGGSVFNAAEGRRILVKESGFTWGDRYGNWAEYDSSGKLLSLGNRNRVKITLIYGPEDGKLIGVADNSADQVLWFEYDEEGHIACIHDASGRVVKYYYDYESGRLLRVVDVLRNETVYSYDSEGRLVSKKDPAGRSVKIAYDDSGYVSRVDAGAPSHVFEYSYDQGRKQYYSSVSNGGGVKEVWFDRSGNPKRIDINNRTVLMTLFDGKQKTVIDTTVNKTTRQYDSRGNLALETYADGCEVKYEYEPKFSNPAKIVNEKGIVTEQKYDDVGNLVQRIEAAGIAGERITEYTYDVHGNRLTMKRTGDAATAEAITRMEYDEKGNLLNITDPEGNTTRFTCDIMGNILARTDARAMIWFYAYDSPGRLMSKTDPLGSTTRSVYDGSGNRIKETDAEERTTTYDYNDNNRLVQVTDPAGNLIRFSYDDAGNLIELTDAEGKTIAYDYDPDGRVRIITDGNGNRISMQYEDFADLSYPFNTGGSGRPASIVYPTYEKRFTFDGRGREILAKEIGDAGVENSVESAYDLCGNVTGRTDSKGRTTHYEYDELNRLIRITRPENSATEYTYDDRDNVIAVRDSCGNVTRFEYDRNDRMTKEIRPLGRETHYFYNEAGSLSARVDAKGQRMAYGYDYAGRLTRVEYFTEADSDTPVRTVEFTYDKGGNLTSYHDGVTSAEYTYDGASRKTGEKVDYGAFELSCSHTYYKNGKRQGFAAPGGVSWQYGYDGNNQLESIFIPDQGYITCEAYTWNKVKSTSFPGGTRSEYIYDPFMRLESLSVEDPAENTILSHSYTYDGDASDILEKRTEGGGYSYVYDGLHRLLEAVSPDLGQETFTYDACGNMLTATGRLGTCSYNSNNELLGFGEFSFGFDANGHTVEKTFGEHRLNYSYDAGNRPAAVEENGTCLAAYYYDPFGRRLWKDAGGIRTYFFYAGEDLVGEYDQNGQETVTYGYDPESRGLSAPLFAKTGSGYSFFLHDISGNPVKAIAANGGIVWSADYDSFGKARVDASSAIVNNFRAGGAYYDQETGLYCHGSRFFDPDLGRYLQPDPEAWKTGTNPYNAKKKHCATNQHE
ncbi:MAG: right-handed parallel beta-helix repeat-containing protein [Pseudomonadota bacterium]